MQVIKFLESDDTEARTVSAVDRGILELKTAVANLEAQVDNIQQKMDSYVTSIIVAVRRLTIASYCNRCTEKAADAVRQSRKDYALSFIRSRKELDKILKQRLGSLEVLQSTLLRVEAASGEIQV